MNYFEETIKLIEGVVKKEEYQTAIKLLNMVKENMTIENENDRMLYNMICDYIEKIKNHIELVNSVNSKR